MASSVEVDPDRAETMSSLQRSRSTRSSGATPRASPIMIMGRGAATSRTRSQEPVSHTASRIESHTRRMRSSLSRTRRGVNPLFTSLRRRR